MCLPILGTRACYKYVVMYDLHLSLLVQNSAHDSGSQLQYFFVHQAVNIFGLSKLIRIMSLCSSASQWAFFMLIRG